MIGGISVALAFLRLLAFYKRLRPQLTEHNITAKLIAIKGIVFISFVQQIVFTVLESTGTAEPSAKLSYNDIYYGIPSMLICGEMIFFAFFHFYAYSAKPYFLHSGVFAIETQKPGPRYYGGPLDTEAFLMALNPLEILAGILQGFNFVVTGPKMGRHDEDARMQPLSTGRPVVDYYTPLHSSQGPTAPRQAHSPDSIEYGRVKQYSPPPRTRF